MRADAARYVFVCWTALGWVLGCGSEADNADPAESSGGASGNTGGSSSNEGGQSSGATTGSGGVGSASGGAAGNSGGTGGSGGRGTAGSGGGNPDAGGKRDAAGNPDAPPVVIANCQSLGGIGVWEQIAPPEAGPPTSLAVDPINSGTVYFGTSPGLNKGGTMGVWKSTDCGATWAHVNTGTNSGRCSAEKVLCSTMLDKGRMWSFGIDPIDPKVLYVNNGYGQGDLGLMKSTDSGVNWWQVWPKCEDPLNCFNTKTDPVNKLAPGFLGDVVVDPYDHKHILIDFHSPCTNVEFCVGESLDAGATWKIVNGDPAMGSAHESRLGFLESSSSWVFIAGGIWRTQNSGTTWKKVSDGGGGGMIYKAKNGAYYIGAGDAIFRSTNVGDSWTKLPETGPFIQGLVGDGTTIFASKFAVGFAYGNDLHPYISTAEDDGTKWTAYPSPGFHQGAIQLGIDDGHHLMFSANSEDGFWRVRFR